MLPALDNRGLLPEGVHAAGMADLEAMFAMNALRTHLLSEFRRFLRDHLIRMGGGLELYMCGSYLTDKVAPGDIDCTIEIPIADVSAHAPLLQLLDDGRSNAAKGWIWDNYHVDVWPTLTGIPGVPNFLAFFQYVGLKSAAIKSLAQTDKRGVVRVEQWILG